MPKFNWKSLDRKSKILVVCIYISIFINSYIFFREPFEFYIGYFVFILLLPVFVFRYGVNKNLFYIFIVLLLSGIFNIIIGNNTAQLFIKVFMGLAMSYFFYYYVILEFDYDIETLFKWYMVGCFYASLLGIAQFVFFQINFVPGYTFGGILNKWGVAPGGTFGIRINSVFAEPTHLAAVLSAAFFVSVYNVFRKESTYLSKWRSLTIIAVYILSFSGLGQTGIFLSLALFVVSFGLVRYLIVVLPVGFVLFTVLYNEVPEFKERLDGLVSLNAGEEFVVGKTHGSSFILYNNYIVATENFKSNFVFGSGIGSHPVAFEKYSRAKNIKTYGFNLNSADANSMFLRLLSETGLFGTGLFLLIVFKLYVFRNTYYDTNHWLISNGLFLMIVLNLFRQGHYFLNGFPFFVLLYIFTFLDYKKKCKEHDETVLQGKAELIA
jgi:O-antigen ligase